MMDNFGRELELYFKALGCFIAIFCTGLGLAAGVALAVAAGFISGKL